MFEKIRDLIADQLGVDADEISMDTNLVDDLKADSLDLVELLMALEEEYDIVVTDEAARELHTVREIVEFMEKSI